MKAYAELLERKRVAFEARGLDRIPALHEAMFPHQRAVTEFALRAGCAAQFLDTGLGKTLAALEWGRVIVEHANAPVLMLAPLAVAAQHSREAERFGIDARPVRDGSQVRGARIHIANYERLDRFDPADFAGVILDESSVLKSFTGATTRALISAFARTPYRLACTATPAPNDHTELGQHAEFLGVMSAQEMLTRFFINDTKTASRNWRLKRHAVTRFWDWVSSWARCVSMPSDLGFSDEGFVLPELSLISHAIEAVEEPADEDQAFGQMQLLRRVDVSATGIHREKRLTARARAERIGAVLAAEPDEPWIVWCDTDYEADALIKCIPGAIEVRGSMRIEEKEERLVAFSEGRERVIVTKPSIAGFGLNWQHCARVAFAGLSFSYEAFYQAVRRSWRFGQRRPVHVHVALAASEVSAWETVQRKRDDHETMRREMRAAMRRAAGISAPVVDYSPVARVAVPGWLVSDMRGAA